MSSTLLDDEPAPVTPRRPEAAAEAQRLELEERIREIQQDFSRLRHSFDAVVAAGDAVCVDLFALQERVDENTKALASLAGRVAELERSTTDKLDRILLVLTPDTTKRTD